MRLTLILAALLTLVVEAAQAEEPVIAFEGPPLQGLCSALVKADIPPPYSTVPLRVQAATSLASATLVFREAPLKHPTSAKPWQMDVDFTDLSTREIAYHNALANGAWLVVGHTAEGFVARIYSPMPAQGSCLTFPGQLLTTPQLERLPERTRKTFATQTAVQ